ncbi:unnamed protein product, partial [Allacma fusca]
MCTSVKVPVSRVSSLN